jgi:low temperature requirement protein LtrA
MGIFGSAYFVVQLLQVILYALASGRAPERRAILRLVPGTMGAPALLIVAGFFDGFAQGALWAVALAVGYGVAYVRGVSGFRIHPGHFAERHGLIHRSAWNRYSRKFVARSQKSRTPHQSSSAIHRPVLC